MMDLTKINMPKFFLYTLAGSVLFLVAILLLYLEAGSSSIPVLMRNEFAFSFQIVFLLYIRDELCKPLGRERNQLSHHRGKNVVLVVYRGHW